LPVNQTPCEGSIDPKNPLLGLHCK